MLRSLLLLSMVFLMLLGAGVWWAYEHRVELINRNFSFGPVQGRLDHLTLSRNGDLEVRNLVLTDKSTRSTVLKIPRLSSKLIWDELWNRRVPSIVLENPEIHLEQSFVAGLLKQGEATASTSSSTSTSTSTSTTTSRFSGIKIGELKINEATLHYLSDRKDSAAITLTYQGHDLETLADGSLRLGEQQVQLAGGRLRLAGKDSDSLSLPQLQLKGRFSGGVLDLDEAILPQLALHVTPELFQFFGINLAEAPTKEATTPLLKGVRIGHVKLGEITTTAAGFLKNNITGIELPETKVTASYEANDLAWTSDQTLSFGAQTLRFTDAQMLALDGDGHLRFKELAVHLSASDLTRWQVESLTLQDPDISWTTTLNKLFIKPSAETNKTPGKMPEILLKDVHLANARIRVSDPGIMPFHLSSQGELQLAQLLFNETGWHSASPQSLALNNVVLGFPHEANAPEKKPFLELPQAQLVVIPDMWQRDNGIEKLSFENPFIRLREGNTPWFDAAVAGPEKPAAVIAAPAAKPWYEQIHFRTLVLNSGRVDLRTPGTKPVDAQAALNITTESTGAGDHIHRLRLGAMEMRLPTLSNLPFPVARAASFEGVVQLPQVWTTHRIEELRLNGASVDAGEALMQLFETEPGTPAPKTKLVENLTQKPKIPWTVGVLSIAESNVTVADIVPGLPAVRFGVKLETKDSPLELDELMQNTEPQRIELADLNIPSPYEPLRPVAQLDSVFVGFSLAGLVRKEIDKIEIVSPTLFVGEDLFWYIDYYRKYTADNTQPAKNAALISAINNALALAEAARVVEGEPPTSQAAWSVKRLQVHSGKLVLAPKGRPLKGFREPFPFNIDTEIKRGTLVAALEIPHDTYPIPALDLELVGMKGTVQFNLPLKDRNNNLVETFQIDSVRWRKLKTGRAFLTVTYDANGIYTKFGAEAYEGYINGECNIYLDDNLHWDGWLGGKNVQTLELTKKLFPGYFLMNGRVEATLVAQGSRDELYQADGSFKNHTPGRFEIQALNQLIEDLPKEWGAIQTKLTEIGLETMRDFDYDHAEAKCRFYGREGTGTLRFAGPNGSRNFEINVYDHRWKTDEPSVTKK
ncbi:MAG: hypothetical protein RL693_607 [Verrucomicrobiota bacterium]|jgi:hypothetical protein